MPSIRYSRQINGQNSCFGKLTPVKKQSGFSLIELMIGITVGLIILAGVVTLMAKTTFSGLENVRAIQLDQQVRGAMDFIHRDLQRAGWVNAWDPAPAEADPDLADYLGVDAITLFGDITLGNCDAGTGLCECVLYSYDRNADGEQGVGPAGAAGAGQNTDNFELYGFRFNANAIEMRISGDAHECDSGEWRDITDASVNVTALSFEHGIIETTTPEDPLTYDGALDGVHMYVALDSDDDSCTANADPDIGDECVCAAGDTCLEKRKFNVVIDAELVSDPGINVRIRNQVAVKNHHYYDMPAP